LSRILPSTEKVIHTAEQLTNRKTLIKSAGLNLLTSVLPLLAGFFAVPYIMATLGEERFGILTLIWAVIGYGMMLDVGLGKALIQRISVLLGINKSDQLPKLVRTSLLASFILGTIGGVVLWFLSPQLSIWLSVSEEYRTETINALQLMAISVPFLICSISCMGVYEAHQRFGFINLVNWPIVLANFVAPFFILPYMPNLVGLVLAVVITRIIVLILLVANLKSVIPTYFKSNEIDLEVMKPQFAYGKWPAITGLVNTLLSSADRFMLSSMMGAAIVAFLTTPNYAIGRFSTFVNSSINVIFPAFGTEYIANPERCKRMYKKFIFLMTIALALPFALIAFFAEPLFSLWINPEFAEKVGLVVVLFCVSGYLQCIQSIPAAFLNAIGKPKVNSMLSIAIMPIFLGLLYILISKYAFEGAAVAIVIKSFIETTFLVTYTYNKFINVPASSEKKIKGMSGV